MNQPSGVIVLDKAAGISSAKAIAQVKHKLLLKKIGHAGSLDPSATGILICLVNNATKLASHFEGGHKTYEGTFRLGIATTTDDMDGEVVSSSENIPSTEEILVVAKEFVGELKQKPPVVSALKVQGVRAYEAFRSSGKVLEIPERTVHVFEFTVTATPDPKFIGYKIVCSKGTYVRAIARDLGAKLGCGACVHTLRRTGSEPFFEGDAVKLSALTHDDIKPIELSKGKKEDVVCQH